MDMETAIGNNNSFAGVLERTVNLKLELNKLGVRKKVATREVNKTDADDDALHVSKEIIESRTLKDIASLDGEIRKYVQSRTVPSPFGAGVYLLSLDTFTAVDAKLEQFQAQRQELVDRFATEYAAAKSAAVLRLGSLYDERDYPSLGKVLRAFGMSWKYVEVGTPGKIRALSPEIHAREVQKAKDEIATATAEIKNMMRAAMADLVDHLVDRLEAKPDGSCKVFRDTLVSNVREFLETFNARNIVEDGELAALVRQAQDIVGGGALSAQMLRDNDGLRDRVHGQFAELKTALDGMMINRPRRKIAFDE